MRSTAVLGLLLLATACADPGTAGSFDPNAPPTGPLTALPTCAPLPQPLDLPPVEGLVLPAGAVITSVTRQPPIVSVTAEVAQTPVQIRVAFEARTDLELLRAEDEVFESELLVSDGAYRTSLTSTAVCRDHSAVRAVVAPEPDSDAATS